MPTACSRSSYSAGSKLSIAGRTSLRFYRDARGLKMRRPLKQWRSNVTGETPHLEAG